MAKVVSRSCQCFDSDAGKAVRLFSGRRLWALSPVCLRRALCQLSWVLCLGLTLGCIPCDAVPHQDASTTGTAGSAQRSPNTTSPHTQTDPDPFARHVEEHMADRRNSERQKMLVSDTDKLLALAQQLKADVDKSNKDMLSIDVVKRAEQIEKLARSVKEKMRGN